MKGAKWKVSWWAITIIFQRLATLETLNVTVIYMEEKLWLGYLEAAVKRMSDIYFSVEYFKSESICLSSVQCCLLIGEHGEKGKWFPVWSFCCCWMKCFKLQTPGLLLISNLIILGSQDVNPQRFRAAYTNKWGIIWKVVKFGQDFLWLRPSLYIPNAYKPLLEDLCIKTGE